MCYSIPTVLTSQRGQWKTASEGCCGFSNIHIQSGSGATLSALGSLMRSRDSSLCIFTQRPAMTSLWPENFCKFPRVDCKYTIYPPHHDDNPLDIKMQTAAVLASIRWRKAFAAGHLDPSITNFDFSFAVMDMVFQACVKACVVVAIL